MKWFIALNARGANKDYPRYAQAAVRSAAKNCPDLLPHLIWDGEMDHPLVIWMKAHGVEVWQHASSLKPLLLELKAEAKYPEYIACGAFLRVELPEFLRLHDCPDHYVVYTDVDVLWLSSDGLREFTPSFCACSTEFHPQDWSSVNTGVMVMNIRNLRRTLPRFLEFCSNKERLQKFVAFDQGAYNEWYRGRISRLPIEWNWKPYWGPNPDASVIHFHGPKPADIEALQKDPEDPKQPKVYRYLYKGREQPYAHALELWKGYATDDCLT